MLFELFKGIKKYYPEYEQSILVLENRRLNKKFVASYDTPYMCVSFSTGIKKILVQTKPTVLFYHKLMASDTSFYDKIMQKEKVPVVVINHTFAPSRRYNKINKCDVVVCVCNNMKKHLKKFNHELNYKVIYNSVDYCRYKDIKPVHLSNRDTIFTGRINALNRIKYSNDWISWCANVKLPIKMVHDYIGAGGLDHHAREFAKKANTKSKNVVKMLGRIEKFKDKVSILKSWDLFLYEINQDEGLSMSLLEAMASGIPVICSDHYGNKEVVKNGVNGYIFKDRNEAKNILKRLCNNRKELKNLQKSTMKYYKDNLDMRIRAKEYVELVEEVYSKKRGEKKKKIKENIEIKEENIDIKEENIDIVEEEKDETKKFTILTSAYNSGKYIKDWAESIIRQDYRPLKVVYINDKSTDNTSELMSKFSKRFEEANIELKYIEPKEKLYCGSGYKLALEEAGDSSYFGVLDSDDILESFACSFVANLYEQYPDITWLYTQYLLCRENMVKIRKGFCCAPKDKETLLSMGQKRIHGFGHWRTFSNRFRRPEKLFKEGLKCSVDKYMGYRLEEFGTGMFVNKVCYRYRSGTKNSVSGNKTAIAIWQEVMKKAEQRRKIYNYKCFSILEHQI